MSPLGISRARTEFNGNNSISTSLSQNNIYFKDNLNYQDSKISVPHYIDKNSPSRSIKFEIGIKKFNHDCCNGIDYLIKRGKLTDAESVAGFLFNNSQSLSKVSVGKFLAKGDPFSLSVLDWYSSLFEFTKMDILTALRKYLYMFVIPGESQQIDRIVESFAKHYQMQNKGDYSDADLCYSVAFSLMIINTTLHNPNVKDKPTAEQFFKSIERIDDEHQLSFAFLTGLFKDIKREPFYYPDQDFPIPHPIDKEKEGWLIKYSNNIYKSAIRRWFVLSDGYLYYFHNSNDREPAGIIHLRNLTVKFHPTIQNCFEIASIKPFLINTYKQLSDGSLIKEKSQRRYYKLRAYSEQDTKAWVHKITKLIKSHIIFGKTEQFDNGNHLSTFL